MELILIQKRIFEIRGQRVMLDFHLAELYGIKTKVLVQALKRNIKRFPDDFMFQINEAEFHSLRSQFVTSKNHEKGRGGRRYFPYAFTEHGITMLSSVLKSETAIKVNIAIVRAYILLKQYNNDFKLLQKRIDELESTFNRKLDNINEIIEFLLKKPELPGKQEKPRKAIGYKLLKKKSTEGV